GVPPAGAGVGGPAGAGGYYCGTGPRGRRAGFSAARLSGVWRAQRFSAWMTSALHRLPGMDEYRSRLQVAELEYAVHSPSAAASLAENYAGFPLAGATLNTAPGPLAKPGLCAT